MAVGESSKVAISSPAQYCGLRLRRGTSFKNEEEGHRASFLVFWAHSKAVSLNFKNEEEGHRCLFSRFLGAFGSGVTKHQKWDTGP